MGRTAACLSCIPLLWTMARAGEAQGLPETMEARLRRLPVLSQDKAGLECGALLAQIEGNRTASPRQRAGSLDRLRGACSDKLSRTDPRLIRIAERSVAYRRPLVQEEPGALSEALRDLGFSYHYLGRMQEAHQLYLEAVAIARRFRGRGTSDEHLAAALESLSSILRDLGKLPASMQAAEESLRLRRQAVPFLPEKVVVGLITRARVEERLSLEATQETLLEAHRLVQELGPGHNGLASRVTSNLGLTFHRLGDLPRAIHFLQEAEELRLRDQRAGRPACPVATTQLLLGEVFFDLGDYPQAKSYYLKAVAGHIACWGKDPFRYGDALTGRATVLEESGEWDEALALQLEALEIRKEAISRDPSDSDLQLALARSFTRLGALQQRMGATEARSSLEHALSIQDRVLARRASVDRAETLVELAEHWRETGDPEQARPLVERCLHELGSLGEQGPLLVRALELSARISADPAAGLRLIEQTGHQVQRLFGPGSPRTATILEARAELRLRQRDRMGALNDALLSQKLSLPHVRTIVQAFPRDQALAFAMDRHQSLDLALDLVAEAPGFTPGTVEQVWQAAASSRMLVRDAEIDRQQLLRATMDPQLASAAQQLSSARERYAYLLVQTHGTIETQAGRLQSARRELLDAEASLAAKTRPLLAGRRNAETTFEQLRRRLPAGATLVAIYQYRQPAGRDAYLAFVLAGSRPVGAVSLGDAVKIDWLVQEWRAAILSPRADAAARMRAGRALRRAIWDPIARLVSGTGAVFLVPDGSFHLVQLAALPAENGSYLIEQGWAFHTLTAERDLLQQREPLRPGPWLALGGVDYQQAAGARPGAGSMPSRDVLRGGGSAMVFDPWRRSECRRTELTSFQPLPGSREEIQDLARLSQRLGRPGGQKPALTTLSGREATEQALRQAIAGRRIVHLATHGFAVARGCGPARPGVRGIGGLSLGTRPAKEDSLPLSGLVLAGANERGNARRSDQDGILTEEEILDLDLGAAEWVVLSACDTGLGRLRPGEGVDGMLRAFQVAGAKTIIVSLWSVRDQAARAWMRELYQARFERRLSTVEAMRQAALHRLRSLRQQGEDNPADWAGFMAVGQWM